MRQPWLQTEKLSENTRPQVARGTARKQAPLASRSLALIGVLLLMCCAKTTPAGESAPDKVFRDRLADGSLGPEMVWIPAGSFRMGDVQGGGRPDEKPVHQVSVQRFAICGNGRAPSTKPHIVVRSCVV